MNLCKLAVPIRRRVPLKIALAIPRVGAIFLFKCSRCPFCLFSVFPIKQYNPKTNYCDQCPFMGFELMILWYESPPLTTRQTLFKLHEILMYLARPFWKGLSEKFAQMSPFKQKLVMPGCFLDTFRKKLSILDLNIWSHCLRCKFEHSLVVVGGDAWLRDWVQIKAMDTKWIIL